MMNTQGTQLSLNEIGLIKPAPNQRPQVVHEWRRRHKDFLKPIATLKTALIWDWQEVKRWAVATGRSD